MLYHDVTLGETLASKSELEAFLRACEQVTPGFAGQHYPEAEVSASTIEGTRVVTDVRVPAGISVAALRQRFPAAWTAAPRAAKIAFYRSFFFSGLRYVRVILEGMEAVGVDEQTRLAVQDHINEVVRLAVDGLK